MYSCVLTVFYIKRIYHHHHHDYVLVNTPVFLSDTATSYLCLFTLDYVLVNTPVFLSDTATSYLCLFTLASATDVSCSKYL